MKISKSWRVFWNYVCSLFKMVNSKFYLEAPGFKTNSAVEDIPAILFSRTGLGARHSLKDIHNYLLKKSYSLSLDFPYSTFSKEVHNIKKKYAFCRENKSILKKKKLKESKFKTGYNHQTQKK